MIKDNCKFSVKLLCILNTFPRRENHFSFNHIVGHWNYITDTILFVPTCYMVKGVILNIPKSSSNTLLNRPEVIKLYSCSTQLSMKFILLINVKMPTIVGISTFLSRINDWLSWFNCVNSINSGYFDILSR